MKALALVALWNFVISRRLAHDSMWCEYLCPRERAMLQISLADTIQGHTLVAGAVPSLCAFSRIRESDQGHSPTEACRGVTIARLDKGLAETFLGRGRASVR